MPRNQYRRELLGLLNSRDSVQPQTGATIQRRFPPTTREQFRFRSVSRFAQRSLPIVAAACIALILPALAVGQSSSPSDTSQQASAQANSPVQPVSPGQTNIPAPAQATTAAAPSLGRLIAFAEFQGSYSELGIVGMIDVDVGFKFTNQISADFGVPLVGSRSPFSPVINHDWYFSGALGEPYVDVRYNRQLRSGATLTSILTGTIPVGNEEVTFTTGRAGVDWFNHVEKKMGLLTPFLNLEASNGAINRFIMPRPFEEARPFETLGLLTDYEVGSEFHLPRFLKSESLGASVYAVVPIGPQKIFSRLVLPYSTIAGDGHHDRYFDSTYETTGYVGACPMCGAPSEHDDRDNGYSGWLTIARFQPFDLQLGYTRSVHYDLNEYTVTLTFDGRRLVKKITGY
ncbi:MAG: hypothetical protein ACRD3O_00535 [Terriglobia bacterium]